MLGVAVIILFTDRNVARRGPLYISKPGQTCEVRDHDVSFTFIFPNVQDVSDACAKVPSTTLGFTY